jgi:hypothetical protein
MEAGTAEPMTIDGEIRSLILEMTQSTRRSTPDETGKLLADQRRKRPSWARIVDALCERGHDAHGVDLLETNGFTIDTVERINQVKPQLLCLFAWRVPASIADVLSRVIAAIPLRKKYHMTLLVAASRREGAGK